MMVVNVKDDGEDHDSATRPEFGLANFLEGLPPNKDKPLLILSTTYNVNASCVLPDIGRCRKHTGG